MNFLDALLLGILEGLTEFLPVSSTGHLIMASQLLGLSQTDFQKTFEIVIQLGSILAVVILFRDKLFGSLELWKRLIIAFIPTGILGFLLYKLVKSLFAPLVVAVMLIAVGIIFLIVDYFYKEKEHQVQSVEGISYKQAFFIGFAQSFSMVPGTSRSGATIIGGLLAGLNRKTAVEFSFLLAVPTMFVATFYDVFKNYHTLSLGNWQYLLTGFIVAFIVAILAIKLFLAFISRYNFMPFAIYRILLGIVFLFYLNALSHL